MTKTIHIFQIENKATAVFLGVLIYCSTEVTVSNRNTRKWCEMYLALKTSKKCQRHHSDIFLAKNENNSHLILVCLLLNLSMHLFGEFFSEYALFPKKVDNQVVTRKTRGQ